MASIKKIVGYKVYNTRMLDVVYESGRIFTYAESSRVPRTVIDFIKTAGNVSTRYTKVYRMDETIYEQ